jgi:AbrB family looped-hinge helix DNA binding protein
METVMKISPQGQIRIPKKIMEHLGLVNGDYLAVYIDHGQMVLKPRKLIDPSQSWYWTKEWQKDEAEADKDIENEKLSPEFKAAEDGVQWLKK